MKKTVFVIAASVALLSACANTAEIRTATPTATYASSKAAKPVAKCILAKLEPMFHIASVQYRDTATGASVWVEVGVAMGKDTAVLMDVDDNAAGSSTRFYSRVLAGEGKYRTAIEDCQS